MTNHTPEYILFGAGAAGRKAMDVFGAERIRCFCDNAKSGELYQGKPVIGIEKLKKCHKSFSVVITIANKSLFLQVARQLMEVGIPFTSYEEEIKKNYPLAWLHFEGDYVSWQQAEASLAEYADYAKGYAEANILDQVSTAIQKVRKGEAVFERDGVLFDDEEYNTGLLSGLFFVATLLSGRGGRCPYWITEEVSVARFSKTGSSSQQQAVICNGTLSSNCHLSKKGAGLCRKFLFMMM